MVREVGVPYRYVRTQNILLKHFDTHILLCYSCECGFFAVEQFPGQVGGAAPIPFKREVIQVRNMQNYNTKYM